MKNSGKKRIIKDYEKLPQDIKEQIKLVYPYGFSENLIKFKNMANENVSALPFETDDTIYLVRMDVQKAKQIILDDDDYDDAGNLKQDIKEQYEDEYSDLDYLD